MQVVSRKIIVPWFFLILGLGIVLLFIPLFFFCATVFIMKIFGGTGYNLSKELFPVTATFLASLFGCVFIFQSIINAWEVAISEKGIRFRNLITRKIRFIKYDEIKKVKRKRYDAHVGGRVPRGVRFDELEIALKSGEVILFEKERLKDIVATHEYIRDKVSEVSQNVEINS